MEKVSTISTSFRLPTTTVDQIEELAKLLKENKTDVLVRAVKRLYEARAVVLDEDINERRIQAQGQK